MRPAIGASLATLATLTTVSALIAPGPAAAADPPPLGNLAPTPPMGWNSWNTFHCDINEQLIRDSADALVTSGMAAAGYQYVNIDDCARGHLAALWEAGIVPARELMPEQHPGQGLKGYAQALELLDLDDPPTAIYAVSDKSARGAYQAIEERGLRVGVDTSVAGTDNVEESAFRSPPLTTFDVHARTLGEEAVRLLARKMAGEQCVVRTTIPGDLVVRESTTAL